MKVSKDIIRDAKFGKLYNSIINDCKLSVPEKYLMFILSNCNTQTYTPTMQSLATQLSTGRKKPYNIRTIKRFFYNLKKYGYIKTTGIGKNKIIHVHPIPVNDEK